jgi:broad specificity polyphosphatase/5'/3'-nucleotidase SurE
VIGGDSPDYDLSEGTDLDAVSKGYISITPLSNMVFDRGLIRKFKKCENILSSQTK